MATTPVSKRVVVSELQKKVATLKVGDFDVVFNYENKAGEPVTSLQVTAQKGNAFVNYNVSGAQTNISFSNTPYDGDLLAAIQVEVDDITKAV